jgi:hypothetical protein
MLLLLVIVLPPNEGSERQSLRQDPSSGALPTTDVWLSAEEIASLPTSGAAWDRMLREADETLQRDTNLAVRDNHNTRTLAAALVAARLDDNAYRAKVRDALSTVVNASLDDDLLAASRRLSTYVIAADLIDLAAYDPTFEATFRDWAQRMLTHTYPSGSGGGYTIQEIHERRPNNWGTHAGASRIATAVYLGDTHELDRAARVFKGWLGDRSTYANFNWTRDMSWHPDPDNPVGINPVGSTIDGHPVDGVLPDDQRRGGSFSWPPPAENYVWEALQGATVQAQLLHRQGYNAWNWEHQAIRRAHDWLHDHADNPAVGDDTWIPWLVNHNYGTDYPTTLPSRQGKAMGFTDWSHATGVG